MIVEGNIIKAEEGKILIRLADIMNAGTEYVLGKTYYIDGILIPDGKEEVPSDFNDFTKEERTQFYPELVNKYIRKKYSASDEFAILRQKEEKPDQFQKYYKFCEGCKIQAKQYLEID